MACSLCHQDGADNQRGGYLLCDDCVEHWDYWANLTPAERELEERSIAAYVSETGGGWG